MPETKMAEPKQEQCDSDKSTEKNSIEVQETISGNSCAYSYRKHRRIGEGAVRFRMTVTAGRKLPAGTVSVKAVDSSGTEIWASSPTRNKVTIHGNFSAEGNDGSNRIFSGQIGIDQLSADTFVFFQLWDGTSLLASSYGPDFGGTTNEDAMFEAVGSCPFD